ncbi:MAG: hypothetical protein NTV02_01665 [Candidatus Zambryskibacteria bacterium]|nr:hypothetical protein [Candidatus Zambryskibacteria bacterium]
MANDSAQKLRFGKVRGHNRLSQKEEIEIAQKKLTEIERELSSMLMLVATKSFGEVVASLNQQRLNSLVWVYTELQGVKIANNIHIAAMRIGLRTILAIADKAALNASFLGKLLNCESGGGWNISQVVRIATAIGIDPRTMLLSDLTELINEEDKKYKK